MATRRVIEVPGKPKHRSPIPHAVVVGNVLFTSVIGGLDPQASGPEQGPEEQVAHAFSSLWRIIEAAGAGADRIGKITVYLKDFRHREFVNREWLRLFPDENDRPARHVMQADLQGNTLIQMDVIAVL